MSIDLIIRAGAPVLAAVVAVLCVWAPAGTGATPAPGCESFASQAAAQDYFAAHGGSPGRPVGHLDPDRNGVACEDWPAPYKGFATIGFNKRKSFFYGTVAMPPDGQQGDGFACLYGNPHFDDGPRLLTVYRVRPGDDRPVTGEIGAQADPGSGRLLWKAEKKRVSPGLYYAEFVERQRLTPYGPNECPGFASAERLLP
jgi:hypothetical protein